MKKNLYFFAAFFCALVLFASCSDDEDNRWKEIPVDYEEGNVVLQVNGQPSTGTVQLDVKSNNAGVLKLTDVISGYPEVSVDVAMTQSDTIFTFSGVKALTAQPESKSTNFSKSTSDLDAEYVMLTVRVNGTVTVSGKMNATVTTSGMAHYIGNYKGTALALKYSGASLLGKEVAVTSDGGSIATLTLNGILPGEVTVAIADVEISDNGAFTGTARTALGSTVNYTGSFAGGVLALDLDVTMAEALQGGLTGQWTMFKKIVMDTEQNRIEKAPAFLKWVASQPVYPDGSLRSDQFSNVASLLLSPIIINVLNDVTFRADGNITATYNTGLELTQEWIMGQIFSDTLKIPTDIDWQGPSPINLANWYVKDNQLYIIPNIEMILRQVSANGGGFDLGGLDISSILNNLQAASEEEIRGLLNALLQRYKLDIDLSAINIKEIMGWLVTGVPVKYEQSGTGLRVYVDKQMVAPFMGVLMPMLPALQAKLDELAATEPMVSLLPVLLGLDQLTDLDTMWNHTEKFELGLEMEKR